MFNLSLMWKTNNCPYFQWKDEKNEQNYVTDEPLSKVTKVKPCLGAK